MSDHPLAGVFPKGYDKKPERCQKCMRTSTQMKAIALDLEECSLLECPHRRRVSAAPGERAPEVE